MIHNYLTDLLFVRNIDYANYTNTFLYLNNCSYLIWEDIKQLHFTGNMGAASISITAPTSLRKRWQSIDEGNYDILDINSCLKFGTWLQKRVQGLEMKFIWENLTTRTETNVFINSKKI